MDFAVYKWTALEEIDVSFVPFSKYAQLLGVVAICGQMDTKVSVCFGGFEAFDWLRWVGWVIDGYGEVLGMMKFNSAVRSEIPVE